MYYFIDDTVIYNEEMILECVTVFVVCIVYVCVYFVDCVLCIKLCVQSYYTRMRYIKYLGLCIVYEVCILCIVC